MSVGAVVLAAGRSVRFGTDKLALDLHGRPVWQWSVEAFLAHPQVDEVVLVVPADAPERGEELLHPNLARTIGGETRQASALAGLRALPPGITTVLFHDAARPRVPADLIDRVLQGVAEHRAAFPGLPSTDTVKQRDADGHWRTLPRTLLTAVQTPQGGRVDDFRRAHAEVNSELTDDVALLEAIGIHAVMVPGDPRTMKLTTLEDWETIRPARADEVRTGLGYDIHAFSADPERPMILGCVEFGDRPGLDGHSDADALAHAVVDAVLGAAALGDIGQHFPNTDPRWRNAPSSIFLQAAAQAVTAEEWRIEHIDATVVGERPRVMPRAHDIRHAIANALGVDVSRISVKATTNEGLGALGRGEGLAAWAVATLRRAARGE